MDPKDLGELERLQRAVEELAEVSRRALGFEKRVEYRGISFLVGPRIVVAELTPLAFLHLSEAVEEGANGTGAIMRLYDRVSPLLSCRHEWTVLKREDDDAVQGFAREGTCAFTCKRCTAYTFGGQLPVVGRGKTDFAG